MTVTWVSLQPERPGGAPGKGQKADGSGGSPTVAISQLDVPRGGGRDGQ